MYDWISKITISYKSLFTFLITGMNFFLLFFIIFYYFFIFLFFYFFILIFNNLII